MVFIRSVIIEGTVVIASFSRMKVDKGLKNRIHDIAEKISKSQRQTPIRLSSLLFQARNCHTEQSFCTDFIFP